MALQTTCLKELCFWVRRNKSHLDPDLIREAEKVIPSIYIERSDSLPDSDSDLDSVSDSESDAGSVSDTDQDPDPGDV